jgi:hypothetical protein
LHVAACVPSACRPLHRDHDRARIPSGDRQASHANLPH